jgi:hypothetical protein
MAGCGIREAALKVGEYHERLWLELPMPHTSNCKRWSSNAMAGAMKFILIGLVGFEFFSRPK